MHKFNSPCHDSVSLEQLPAISFTLILSASGDPELLALILPQIPTFSRALKIKIKAPLYSCRGGAVVTNDWGFS